MSAVKITCFPADASGKPEAKCAARGGFKRCNRHINNASGQFPHIDVHARLRLEKGPRLPASARPMRKAGDTIERNEHAARIEALSFLERQSTKEARAVCGIW